MRNVTHAKNRASLFTFIARMATFRPGHIFLWFVLKLLMENQNLLVGLLSKAYFDALDGTRLGLAASRIGLAALPVTAIVILLALEGLLEVGVNVAWLVVGGSLSFRTVALLWHNVLIRVLELPGARALPPGTPSPEGASDDGAPAGATASVGAALSTLRDDAEVLEGVTGLHLSILAALLQLGLALSVMLAIDAQVTLWMMLPLGLTWSIGYAMRGRAERLRAASREASAAYSGALGEALTLAQAIQVAGAHESVMAHLRRRGSARQEASLREALYQGLLNFFYWGWISLLYGALLLVASRKLRAGSLSVGDLSLFLVLLADLGEWMGKFIYALVDVRLGRVSLRRMLALMRDTTVERLVEHRRMRLRKAPPAPPPRSSPVKSTGEGVLPSSPPRALHATASGRRGLRGGEGLQMLKAEGLTVRHTSGNGGSPAGIEDVSFELARGTLTVVVGRIGAGKSTLLRALLGLLPLDDGEIRWNDQLVDDPATFLQPPRAGYTPQVPGLLSATLRENVLLDWPVTDEELDRAVHDAVLERDVAEFPEGLDTLIGVRGRRLSGGQAQRTALARMLVRRPELLVMDDVSSALDVETEQVLWQRLLDGRGAVVAPSAGRDDPGGRDRPARTTYTPTCLVVSHRRTVLDRADQILLLENGRITDRGTLKELLARSSEMRRLCADGSET